jgi:hypothetical protein
MLREGRRTIKVEINLSMGLFNMFKPGDLVPTSGVYATWHSTPHALIEHPTSGCMYAHNQNEPGGLYATFITSTIGAAT